MRLPRPPLPVLLVAAAYLAVGIIGGVVHFQDLLRVPSEGVWMEITELVALVTGVFLLRGANWARWLAVAWILFHVGLSAFGRTSDVIVHAVFAVLIAWLLFRPGTTRWFRAPHPDPA